MVLCADRENAKKEFDEIFKKFTGNQKNLIYYYGIPGIGKSVLLEYIEGSIKAKYPDLMVAYMDFNHNESVFFLFDKIYNQLKKQGVDFYSYELARDYICERRGDTKYKIEGKSYGVFNKLIEASFEFINSPIKKVIATAAASVAEDAFTKIRDVYKNYMIKQFREISESKIDDVINNLGIYLIRDINAFCEKNRRNILYFVDTFEKCCDSIGFTEDNFIKEYILNSEYSFWVVAGTNKKIFEKYKDDYFSFIHTESLDNFDELKHIEEILKEQYDIKDLSLAKKIFKLSNGYPAAVDMIIQTYIEMRKISVDISFDVLEKEVDTNEFYQKFFQKYYKRHVIGDDLNVLVFLACFDKWDYSNFEYYSRIENNGNPRLKFEKLKKYVIVRCDINTDSYSIIDIAKKCLLNADSEITGIITEQAFDYLHKELKKEIEEKTSINMQKVDEMYLTAIKLGKYILLNNPCFAEKYYKWFIKFEQSLTPKMLYELKGTSIEKFMEATEDYLSESFKDDIHSNCKLQVYYDYAWTFCYRRQYEEAYEHITKYEKLAKNICADKNDERIVKAKYTKAVILQNQGEYEQSLKLHNEVLEIRKTESNDKLKGISYNCIALLYMLMNDFGNAQFNFDKSLEYRSKEKDLIGFCTAHANISKMYFLKAVFTGNTEYLACAEKELDIALDNLPETKYSALYKSWKIRYTIINAQKLRFKNDTVVKDYICLIDELKDFYGVVINNPQYGMLNHLLTTENNIAVMLALMGDVSALQKFKKCLASKKVFYNVDSNKKSKPYLITKENLRCCEDGNISNLLFEY